MGNSRGFRIRHKLVKVFNWSVLRRRNLVRYGKVGRANEDSGRYTGCTKRAIFKLCELGRYLKKGLFKSNMGYIRVGNEVKKPVCSVPKGHLAVYVGEEENDAHRVLVPVIFFNHPLFGDLLKEAEELYGFNHPGGIQIPCRISEFENVQTKIITSGGSNGSGGGGKGGCRWSTGRRWRLTNW